jgi:hypothetical protein
MFEDRSWEDLMWWSDRSPGNGLSVVILKNYLIGLPPWCDYVAAVIEDKDSILLVR